MKNISGAEVVGIVLLIAVVLLAIFSISNYVEKRKLCQEKGGVFMQRERVCAKPDNFIPLK